MSRYCLHHANVQKFINRLSKTEYETTSETSAAKAERSSSRALLGAGLVSQLGMVLK